MAAAPPPITPDFEFEWGPSSSAPTAAAAAAASPKQTRTSPYLSPPLIAMLAVVGAAFLIVLYARILSHLLRRWRRRRRRRRLLRTTTTTSSSSPGPFDASDDDYFLSPYGLDFAAITALPLSLFSKQSKAPNRDCAVCLLEFEPGESLRTLPLCSHAFHVDCIDVWLRSHATCPLCRAAVFRLHDSPFVPMRAARIRPSIDDLTLLEAEAAAAAAEDEPEITVIASPRDRDWFLKRSYSFGFERTERMVAMEAATASPWRYRSARSFWSKRWPSPFGGSASASRMTGGRVFSFRSYRSGMTMKSPFTRRRGWFLPLSSEPRMTGGWSASRRSRSMASPSAIFMRAAAASSRMRCGDPEALVSPERLNRR